MGAPAARLGDPMAHGGAIVVGCPTVLIGGAPAARVGDMHVCPMMTPGVPPIPHVGGPIVKGAFVVLLGNMPSARVGDTAVCVGPTDTIAMGAPTVLIGEGGGGGGGGGGAGASGASMGAAASSVQAPAGAAPRAEARADGTWVTRYNAQITIEGPAEYQAQMIYDLRRIMQIPQGRALLRALRKADARIVLRLDDEGDVPWRSLLEAAP